MTFESLKRAELLKTECGRVMPKHSDTPFLMNIIACEERVEEAVLFLVKVLAPRSRPGKKAVILHSLRVGFYLMSLGYREEVVIAGILHDVSEKTDHTPVDLGRRFGTKTGRMIAAMTKNRTIPHAFERYQDSVQRCLKYGNDAVVVRAADLLDNFDRIYNRGNDERISRIADKLRLMLKTCRASAIDPRVVDALARRLKQCSRRSMAYGIG